MQGLTWNKAAVAAVVAPIADWVVTIASDRLELCCSLGMPAAVSVALSSLIVGLAVYYVPNKEA